MAEARQRTTVDHVSWLVMVGLVVAGCMSTPKRPIGGNTGGEGPDEPGDPPADAAAPTKKMDAAKTDPMSMPTPDASALEPDVGGPTPDAKGGAEVAAMTADAGASAVTFTELWMTVFGTPAMQPSSCAGAACHNPGVKDMVNMSSKEMAYATLSKKVVKGNPAMSKLMTRLTSTNAMQRMPLGKPALSKELIDKVRAWIAAGANND